MNKCKQQRGKMGIFYILVLSPDLPLPAPVSSPTLMKSGIKKNNLKERNIALLLRKENIISQFWNALYQALLYSSLTIQLLCLFSFRFGELNATCQQACVLTMMGEFDRELIVRVFSRTQSNTALTYRESAAGLFTQAYEYSSTNQNMAYSDYVSIAYTRYNQIKLIFQFLEI